MDNLGAIFGPLLALGLVAMVGVRTAIGLSVIPGLLAALAIVYAIRHVPVAPQASRTSATRTAANTLPLSLTSAAIIAATARPVDSGPWPRTG